MGEGAATVERRCRCRGSVAAQDCVSPHFCWSRCVAKSRMASRALFIEVGSSGEAASEQRHGPRVCNPNFGGARLTRVVPKSAETPLRGSEGALSKRSIFCVCVVKGTASAVVVPPPLRGHNTNTTRDKQALEV